MSDWKYDLDDVGPDGVVDEYELPPVEKGSPSLENAIFVLLGVLAALYVFATLLGLG
ncbi:MAG: DUF7312 domain-containing protein [Halobacteriota archaeon]